MVNVALAWLVKTMADPKDVAIEMTELLEGGQEVVVVDHAPRPPERIRKQTQDYGRRKRQFEFQQQFYCPAGTEIAQAAQECHVL